MSKSDSSSQTVAEELCDCVANLNQGMSVDRRAPHKPLLLLLAIAEVQEKHERLTGFVDLEQKLRTALALFGRPAKSAHPEYPFWRLQTDRIWEVRSNTELIARESNTDPPVSELRNKNAEGGFVERFHKVLVQDASLQTRLIHQILDSHFPRSLHSEIVDFFGLRIGGIDEFKYQSELAFRKSVLAAYGNRCVISGLGVSIGGIGVGIEAAYLRWPSANGPFLPNNGLALNSFYRKLFDLGVLSVDPNLTILV